MELDVFLRLSHDPIMVLRFDGHIQSANAKALQLFGFHSMMDLDFTCLLMEACREETMTFFNNCKTEAFPKWSKLSTTGLHKDGRELNLQLAFFPVFAPSSNFTSKNNVVVVDVLSHSFFASTVSLRSEVYDLINFAPEGIFVVDSDDIVVTVNQKLVAMLGYSQMELKGFHIENILPEFIPIINSISDAPFYCGVLNCIRADSSMIDVEVTVQKLILNHCSLVVGVVREASAMLQTQKMIEEKENAESDSKLKNIFFNNLSKLISTPLNEFVEKTEQLSTTDLSKEQKIFVRSLRSCGMSLLNMTEDFSKNFSTHLDERVGNMVSFLDDLRILFSGISTTNPSIKFHFQVNFRQVPLPIIISADYGKLRQVLINLVQNAIKYTDQGNVTFLAEVIKVDHGERRYVDNSWIDETKRVYYTMRFSVVDTGIGISPEIEKSMYSKFNRDERVPIRYPSSGLGLSITKHLVDMMGGFIGYKTRVGQGTHFWVIFTFQSNIEVGSQVLQDSGFFSSTSMSGEDIQCDTLKVCI